MALSRKGLCESPACSCLSQAHLITRLAPRPRPCLPGSLHSQRWCWWEGRRTPSSQKAGLSPLGCPVPSPPSGGTEPGRAVDAKVFRSAFGCLEVVSVIGMSTRLASVWTDVPCNLHVFPWVCVSLCLGWDGCVLARERERERERDWYHL